ncbi:hypothetical protein, partial [Microcoleus sp.]|uniref:hypothetical protein n=1 Tax=Microcoleus sp. TaxID=44472 RepID=UPI00403E57E9
KAKNLHAAQKGVKNVGEIIDETYRQNEWLFDSYTPTKEDWAEYYEWQSGVYDREGVWPDAPYPV